MVKWHKENPEVNGWYICADADGRVLSLYFKNGKWLNNAVKHIFDTYDVVSKYTGQRISYDSDGCYDFEVEAWTPLPEYKRKNYGSLDSCK